MKYAKARELIKTGDALLYRDHPGGGLRAIEERWIVRHGTATPYCHVGMAWVDHGRVWIIDITTRGCAPRLLSTTGPFDWAPAPRQLSDQALDYAFACFGELTYSRWRAVMGALKLLVIGASDKSECAEYFLAIMKTDGMAPTDVATPGAVADGVMQNWRVPITPVEGC